MNNIDCEYISMRVCRKGLQDCIITITKELEVPLYDRTGLELLKQLNIDPLTKEDIEIVEQEKTKFTVKELVLAN